MNDKFYVSPPEPLEPVPFSVPATFETSLKNGLRVVILPHDRLPLISFRLAFFSGDANDGFESIGLTSAMMSMLTEGTQKHSSRELAEKIERLGASLSASSSDDFSVISGSALSIYRTEILDLIAEILFRPSFPKAELDLYKRNTVENLTFQRSQPGFLASEQVARILYGNHPYSRISPTPREVQNLSRDALLACHAERMIPNNAVFIAVGDVEVEPLLKEIETYFGDWQRGNILRKSFTQPSTQVSRSLTVVDRPGSAQANIVMANLAIPRNHPDYFPVLVMNQILGAGASSRVFMNLREEKGYTYGAYTRFDAKRYAGDFEASAEVRTAVTGASLDEFFFELNRIRNEAVDERELQDAKDFLTGVFPIRAETQEGLTNLIVSQQLYDLPKDYLQTYRDHVAAVAADDVRRVASEYIRPESLAIVIVGDATGILPQAEKFAESIEIFDTDGNRRDKSDFDTDSEAAPENFEGEWDLKLDFQGQEVDVKLVLIQTGRDISGTLRTILGEGEIAASRVNGKKISATAVTEIQGQSAEFIINGEIEGGTLSGTIATPLIPDSLKFSGTRSHQADATN